MYFFNDNRDNADNGLSATCTELSQKSSLDLWITRSGWAGELKVGGDKETRGPRGRGTLEVCWVSTKV